MKTVYITFNEFTPPITGEVMVESENEVLVRCEESYTTDGDGNRETGQYATWDVHLPLGTHWVKKEQVFDSVAEAYNKYAFSNERKKFEKYQADLKKQALEIEAEHKKLLSEKIKEIQIYKNLEKETENQLKWYQNLNANFNELKTKKETLEKEVLTLESIKKLIE